MKVSSILLLLITSVLYQTTSAQFIISGKVIDAESKEPLSAASLFCRNTTQGTMSNKLGEFALSLKPGGYELIISYSGYTTKQILISNNETAFLEIELSKEEKNMEEVIIQSSNLVTDGLEKYGPFFNENFIGATAFAKECKIQNPEVLQFYFYRRSNRLKVMATEPLIIINHSLGYKLTYQLDSFLFHYQTDLSSYRGYCFYEELQGNYFDRNNWTKNREAAYFGSRLHFLRSYFDSTLKENGFIIDIADENAKNNFRRIPDPYDGEYYFYEDSTAEADLFYKDRIQVTYTKKVPENAFLKKYILPMNIGVQTSFLNFNKPIVIRQNGFYYNQEELVNQGYWSWKNLADQLPYDYEPTKKE